ncbi:MAG: hypothetical protein Q9M37_00975 [Desulfonauticus sp.]|nr:hypothetical protein [Desulfonauticus sp.]
MFKKLVFCFIFLTFFTSNAIAAQTGFTQRDRELLIELKVKMQEIDKRFEQIDKRFDEVNSRFEQIINFMWMLVVIFSSMTAVTIGFAMWDRRSMVRPFEDKIKTLEQEKISKIFKLIETMKILAKTDPKIKDALKQANLL